MISLESQVVNQHGNVKVLNAWNILDEDVMGIYQGHSSYSDEGIALFKEWCKAHGVFYYGRPREDFFEFEAYQLAEAADCSYIILDDMS